ncbi:MAG: hypothetical protein AB7S81_08840 [Bdellovibrionales bacterium]
MYIFLQLIFLLYGFTLASPALAVESCPPFETAVITISPLLEEPQYDFSQGMHNLLAMGSAQDRHRFSSTEKETPVGLTAAAIKFKTNYQIIKTVLPSNYSVCAQIKNLRIDFGFDDTVVYVARELPRNSCSFREVFNHELKHVNKDRQLVLLYAPEVESQFRELINRIGIVHTTTSYAAELEIKKEVNDYINKLSSKLAAIRQEHQQEVDSREEYARLQKACNGDLESYVRQYRR